MGSSLCSIARRTCRSIPTVTETNLKTPKISQSQVPKLPPKVSEQDSNSKSLSVPSKKVFAPSYEYNQPRRGVISEIAKDATGVAIGTVVGTRISKMLDGKKDVKQTDESSMESDLKNEKLNEDDGDGQVEDNHNSDGQVEENYNSDGQVEENYNSDGQDEENNNSDQ